MLISKSSNNNDKNPNVKVFLHPTHHKQKAEQKYVLQSKLCKIKHQNDDMQAKLQRASKRPNDQKLSKPQLASVHYDDATHHHELFQGKRFIAEVISKIRSDIKSLSQTKLCIDIIKNGVSIYQTGNVNTI